MKIVLINVSPRKNGATAGILRAMEERLAENGAETELFNNRSQSKPRHTWFCKGVCSPDGRQLLIYNYMDMWSLPLAKIMAETELIK